MDNLISGALVMGYIVAGLFFVRYWTHTRDRLFLFFSAAFALLAAQRLLLSIAAGPGEQLWLYLVRSIAFILIIIGIVDKNRRA